MGQQARTYLAHKDRMYEYLGGMCVTCFSIDRLQVDHIDPSTKQYNLSCRVNTAWDNLLLELDKCQLLCHRCHWRKTLWQRREATARAHGHESFRSKNCTRCVTEYDKLKEELDNFYD